MSPGDPPEIASDPGACWEANADAWTELSRAGHDVYRDAHNTPAFLEMLPDVAGLSGLDIGCGEGTNTRAVARRGARMSAIDIAPSFIAHARATEAAEPLGIDYRAADARALPFEDARLDFATAFMSLMDMPDQLDVLREARRVIAPGGFFQLSILHPCFAPPHRRTLRDAAGTCYAVEVAGYFDAIDGEVESWCFGDVPEADRARLGLFRVPRYHRTLTEWVAMIRTAGFAIDDLREPTADAETAARVPHVADTRVTPLFLHLRLV